MSSVSFCYWLQGYFELVAANPGPAGGLTPSQADCIARHLAMVFAHDIDPKAGGPEVQMKLNDIYADVPAWMVTAKSPDGSRPRC